MNSRDSRRRRVLLLFCALLMPCVVLVTLGVRMVRQDAELAEKRLEDDQREAADQLRREISARLDAIRLQEMSRLEEGQTWQGRRDPESVIVFIATLDKDRLVPPWKASKAPAFNPRFLDYIYAGETLEFKESAFGGALNAYRYAHTAARTNAERCHANLRVSRVLVKSDHSDQAGVLYHAMLKDCDAVVDEDGVALSSYAAERLATLELDPAEARRYVLRRTTDNEWRTPVETYLIRSLLSGDTSPEAVSASAELSDEIHDSEGIMSLARDIEPLGRPSLSLHADTGTNWLAYGDEPWLITTISAGVGHPSSVLAVHSQKVAPPGVDFLPADSEEGFLVGEGLGGLRGEWEPGRFTPTPIPYFLYAGGLVLILAVTTLAGYLLIRDVDREVQTAELRAHFVASVSHELKTPLTAIRMFAETLVTGRTKDLESRARYLQTIFNESERLSRLVDNVLDFARIEQEQKIYQMKNASLAAIARSTIQTIQYPLERQHFRLNVSIDDTLPPVMADADALEQAMLNLLANAMKYSGDSRQIEFRLRREGNEAVVEIEDHGVGICLEDQERIFEKFFRVRSAETDRVPGAGLGLTLAAHAVKAHGGRISVKSAPGVGSTFSIHLPLHNEGASA